MGRFAPIPQISAQAARPVDQDKYMIGGHLNGQLKIVGISINWLEVHTHGR